MASERSLGPSLFWPRCTVSVAGRRSKVWARRWWRHHPASALAAPFTCGYLLLLLATTLFLRHLRAASATAVLAASSTDVEHLVRDPVTVLVTSALWLPGGHWWPYAVVFMLVLAPLERRFGAASAVLVFLSGHVLATLATEVPVAVGILLHLTAPGAAHRLDVGVSYGMFAVVSASTGAARKRWRAVVLTAVTAWLVWRAWQDPDMTAFGHLLALAIGVAWCPLLYRGAPMAPSGSFHGDVTHAAYRRSMPRHVLRQRRLSCSPELARS